MDEKLRLREGATSPWVHSQAKAQVTLGCYTQFPVWSEMEEMQAATAWSLVVPESWRGRA